MHPRPWATAIDKATRNHCLWIADHLAEIEAWRETLAANQRDAWNHPTTIKRQFERATLVREAKEAGAPVAVSPMAQLRTELVQAQDAAAMWQRRAETALAEYQPGGWSAPAPATEPTLEAAQEVVARWMASAPVDDVAAWIEAAFGASAMVDLLLAWQAAEVEEEVEEAAPEPVEEAVDEPAEAPEPEVVEEDVEAVRERWRACRAEGFGGRWRERAHHAAVPGGWGRTRLDPGPHQQVAGPPGGGAGAAPAGRGRGASTD